MVQAGEADTGAPADSVKSSWRTIAEGVSTTVISAAIIGAAVKVVFPVIVSIAALVVAGVSAINGQFIAALVSGIGGVLSGLLSYYLGRRQVIKDWHRRLENVQSLSVEKLNGGMRLTFPDEDERRGNGGEGS